MRILDVGSRALLVEVDDLRAGQRLYRAVRRLAETDADLRLDPPRDLVPGARTVLLDGIADVAAWRRRLGEGGSDAADDAPLEAGREVVIRLSYDGPDLDEVASAWGCSRDELPGLHQATAYTVAFCGFAPGFAYCVGDQARPAVPRRADPRTRVPAGSVGLAGEFCGIYPSQLPGGWQLVGRTDAVLFDVTHEEPALLRPGDRVRFEALS